MTMETIYLAARYSRRAELAHYRDGLEALGYEVTSRWLSGSHDGDPSGLSVGDVAFERRCANEDLEDILRAEWFVLFTDPPRAPMRGGKHVEYGVALAARKRIVLVGEERENVFQTLPSVMRFAEWFSLLRMMADRRCEEIRLRSGTWSIKVPAGSWHRDEPPR